MVIVYAESYLANCGMGYFGLQVMYIEDCIKKDLFGTIERSKLPANLSDYYCQLCIEEYAQGPISEEIKYFRFTPRGSVKAEPFTITIDTINKPKNLIYQYKIVEKETERGIEPELIIGDRIEYKIQTSVIEPPKKESCVENLPEPDSEGEFMFRDIDESRLNSNLLRLQDSDEQQNNSGESKCVQPSEGDKGTIKNELISYLHVQDNKFAKLKDVRSYLQNKGHKISEYGLKQLLAEVCKTNPSDRKAGFLLKDYFFSKDQYDRRNPKKKVKEE